MYLTILRMTENAYFLFILYNNFNIRLFIHSQPAGFNSVIAVSGGCSPTHINIWRRANLTASHFKFILFSTIHGLNGWMCVSERNEKDVSIRFCSVNMINPQNMEWGINEWYSFLHLDDIGRPSSLFSIFLRHFPILLPVLSYENLYVDSFLSLTVRVRCVSANIHWMNPGRPFCPAGQYWNFHWKANC